MKMANKKSKKRTIFILVLALLTLAMSAVAITGKAPLIRLYWTKSGEVQDGLLPRVSGHVDYVPKGEIRYLINKNMFFESPYSQGTVMLENPESCEYDLIFTVYNSEGGMIYTSPVLKPGQCIEKDKLSAVVKRGEYECTYSAQAYKDGKLMGHVTGILKVTVG